jgi:hypothetical protein
MMFVIWKSTYLAGNPYLDDCCRVREKSRWKKKQLVRGAEKVFRALTTDAGILATGTGARLVRSIVVIGAVGRNL